MKLVLLIDIEQSVICVCFSHEFDFIVFLGYIYMRFKYYGMMFNFKLN